MSGGKLTAAQLADLLNVSVEFVEERALSAAWPHTVVAGELRFGQLWAEYMAERMRAEREAALREMVPEGGYGPEDF